MNRLHAFIPRKIILMLALLAIPFLQMQTYAEDPPQEVEKSKRPTVGLVLSGGGAKGFAYIGLLKVLQETGLQVDYIGGSSIGSIMGGLYAIGYHPDSIAKMIRMQNWTSLLSDGTARKYVAYDEKEFGEKTILSVFIRNRKIGLSNAFYQGQQVDMLLGHYFSPAYKTYSFSDFQTPFLCMGTDLFTGDAIVLNKGYLPKAIRASMSIPGYFAPTEYMGYYLVDGGVVNNYPVKQVKEMGAEIIIGGDVQQGLYTTKKQLSSMTAILDQITSFPAIEANQVGDSLTNISVRIKLNYGMMDFDDYDSIIAVGERVARAHYAEIKALADSLNALEYRPLKKYDTKPLDSLEFGELLVKGNVRTPAKYFFTYFRDIKGHRVAIKDLETIISYMYGSHYFDRVTYEMDNTKSPPDLIIDVVEAAPGILSAGIHFDNDYNGSIILNGAFRNLLGKNTKLFATLILGVNPRLKAFYLVGFSGKAGLGISTDFYSFKFNIYDKSTKIDQLTFTNYKASLFFNSMFLNMYNIRAGFDYEYFRFRQDLQVDTSITRYQNFKSYGTPFISINADTRDDAYFPTRGFLGTLRAEYVMPLSGNWVKQIFTNSAIIYLNYIQSIPLSKKFTLRPGIFAGGALKQSDSPPVQHLFALGGLNNRNYVETFLDFSGAQFVQNYGNYALVGRLKLQYNLFKKNYITLRTDVGGSEQTIDELFQSRSFMVGYGVTYSYNSFIGPIELSLMGSNVNSGPMLFLNLGFWF
ncbi:MAG: patatin-like phospholipase family protein [Bacteroidales bacterium]|nr:patatin-like phospholipase family protein [Bacteroidales bacterium]